MAELLEETGYEAWLRYPLIESEARRQSWCELTNWIDVEGSTATEASAVAELKRGLTGMLGEAPGDKQDANPGVRLEIDASLPAEGYRVRKKDGLIIEGADGNGILYGCFALLQHIQAGGKPDGLPLESAPSTSLRLLNHWDNLTEEPVHEGIERVRGGKTIFDWTDLARPNPRYEDYARMLASVGINGTCLNNVNADPTVLDSKRLQGLASLGEILRRWGIRMYLCINYASPVLLGGLPTADPAKPEVERWWKDKVEEIYRLIPDFGGFVVKADSEGQPGPGEYGHGHVAGSAPLARALAPHGGLLFWRAFVYGRDVTEKAINKRMARDKASQAVLEFNDLDGQFEENVILQIKCCATDFHSWEPVHSLWCHLPKTRVCLELMVAQEYLGLDTHICWQAPYWKHVYDFDTGLGGDRGTVAQRISASQRGAVAGVSNICNARNWFGHLLAGANLFAFGRQAWNPASQVDEIAGEYARLMFGTGKSVSEPVASILLQSYQTYNHYTTPLGANMMHEHLRHYEPDPWGAEDYSGANRRGIGKDRSHRTGSAYTALYKGGSQVLYEFPGTCPANELLFFHHLPWDYQLPGGNTLVQKLYDLHYAGVEEVEAFRKQWRALNGKIDLSRWAHVYEKLAQQLEHARRWRDIVCRYLLERSGIPDDKERFTKDSPSPHNRVQSGFEQAWEDYRYRVKRRLAAIAATQASNSHFE